MSTPPVENQQCSQPLLRYALYSITFLFALTAVVCFVATFLLLGFAVFDTAPLTSPYQESDYALLAIVTLLASPAAAGVAFAAAVAGDSL